MLGNYGEIPEVATCLICSLLPHYWNSIKQGEFETGSLCYLSSIIIIQLQQKLNICVLSFIQFGVETESLKQLR